MFLTPEQLETLTGLRQPAAQRRWLARQGIRYRERADGKPVVLEADLHQTAPPPARPRFDLVRRSG
jgi:hypothetical protein